MTRHRRSWPFSAILLAVFGVALFCIGAFFMFLRPPLLPEDVRFVGLSLEQLQAGQPRMASWLERVFQVLGGYAVAAGILTVTIAATSFRRHERWALLGVLASGVASIGWMAVVNFVIGSDFRWVLLAVAILWAASVCTFVVEIRQAAMRAGGIG
ncbi:MULTISPECIES: hypothetical protein [unclassified Mesorhizobium]|uniref:hypothetical protein n=1 Tax=unclassified Mesorhizobium TaxID=325217 RepID=UPI000FCAD53A|nr:MULTISPECIES: hypothetical protein [unclassified Mesorhizobium]RUX31725.1 hypothetical protein EOA23_10580 [Mesorhizobium sp. M2A.F.Ca.ET.042.01.1.1]RWE72075.1 MAG: hypothetical protein EOS42_24470 [Mesorhizobium sp.]